MIDLLKQELGELWIPSVYRDKVRSKRTRSFAMNVPEKANDTVIHHTLLGIELNVGKLRVSCPDLATARYLRVFARLGVRTVAVPYDISRISALADELETGWQRLQLLLADASARARSGVIKALRLEILEIGPGEAMPAFDTPTRQRTRE